MTEATSPDSRPAHRRTSRVRRTARLLAMLAAMHAVPAALHADDDKNGGGLTIKNWDAIAMFGSWPHLDQTVSVTDTFCVAANSGVLQIVFESSGGYGESFAMLSGAWVELPYHVLFSPPEGGYRAMRPGVGLRFEADKKACKDGRDNVGLRIEVRPEDFNGAETGLYGDILTAMISAE